MPRTVRVLRRRKPAKKPAKRPRKLRVLKSGSEGSWYEPARKYIPSRDRFAGAYNAYKGYSKYADPNANAIDKAMGLDLMYSGFSDVIYGKGGYRVKKNTISNKSQVPYMHSMKDGFRIRHREYIGDVNSSTAFSNSSYSVNPGLNGTFPWLSAIAQNFEEYSIEGMVVEFKSTSADALNSTNTALGTIILCAEYNVLQPAYVNKQQMENSLFCMSAKPSECIIMPIECDKSQNPFKVQYIRNGDVTTGDLRMYDLCNFQIASVGSQQASVVGELWLSYDIILRKPQLSSGLGLALKTAHYSLVAPAISTAYLGTSRTERIDTYGLTLSGTVVTIPAGTAGVHHLNYGAIGASTASLVRPITTYTNATLLNCWRANDLSSQYANGTSDTGMFDEMFRITDPSLPVTITFSGGLIPTTPTGGDLVICQVNGDYA